MAPVDISLTEAVEKHKLPFVKYLVQREDVNLQDNDGNTALHLAVKKLCEILPASIPHLEHHHRIDDLLDPPVQIVLCLAEYADVSITNHEGKQPIHLMLELENCHLFVVLRLIHSEYEDLSKAVMCLITPQVADDILIKAINFWQYELAQLVVDKGADITLFSRTSYFSPLHALASNGDPYDCTPPENLISSLAGKGMLNAQDENGTCAFHYAVQFGKLTVFRQLMKLNADASLRDVWNRKPIDKYCVGGDIELHMIIELLKVDKDINISHFLNIFN